MRLRDESGFTLTELLTAMGLMLVILSATLTTLESFARTNEQNVTLNDMREDARVGIDGLARELRNARARSEQVSPIERAEPLDLVFADVHADGSGGYGAEKVRRVRYCLEQTTVKAGRLWRQEQDWTAALPAALSCPHPSFGSQKLAADGVVNHAVEQGGANPPIFTYDATDLVRITRLGAALFVDTDVDRAPATTVLSTGVRLRNRNRPPVAGFTATPQGNRHVLLNAGISSDPDGQQLDYSWTCDGSPCPAWTKGSSLVDYQVSTAGSHTFGLTVTDTGDLTSPPATQTLVVP